MYRARILSVVSLLLFAAPLTAADWNQWRGSSRDGLDHQSPSLIEALPASGLPAVWVADKSIAAAQSGGWSSPIVANGKVYLFAHKKTRLKEGAMPRQEFPWLPPEKRVGMSDDEYAEYEKQRRDEDQIRASFFRHDEFVYCLNADNGEVMWTHQRDSIYTRFPQSGSPTVIDGRLYFLGAGRMAYCIDAVTGKDLWQRKLTGDFRDEFLQSSIVVADGVAVVLCGSLFGLDTATGEIFWEGDKKTTHGTHSSPVVWSGSGRDLVIANVGNGDTMCLEPRTGKELWRIRSEGGQSTPVIAGDRLITYGSSRKRGLRCFRLSPSKATHEWTFNGTADPGSSPVVVGGNVFVQGDRRLACVDLVTGETRWNATLDMARPRYTSLVAADGKVFYTFDSVLCFRATSEGFRPLMTALIDETGLLADESAFRQMLDLETLEETAEGQKESQRIWRKKFNNTGPLACASPAIVDGKLFLRTKKGLACFDLTAKPVVE
jgi:outer membrane protein assembly factor BamB